MPLWANVVGPFHNPSETYQYYDLPFCRPSQMGRPKRKYKRADLGEVLEGDRLVTGPFDLPFRVDKHREKLCSVPLDAQNLERLQRAVRDDYYFQMFYDDLPLWGFLGKVERPVRAGVSNRASDDRLFLFTHTHFDVLYNGDRVIRIDVSTDPMAEVDITTGPEGGGPRRPLSPTRWNGRRRSSRLSAGWRSTPSTVSYLSTWRSTGSRSSTAV